MHTVRTLIVDNYDSYTFNLLQLWDRGEIENVVVIRNDQFDWPTLRDTILPHFDNIVISPGPGRPEHPADFGICTELLRTQSEAVNEADCIPIFGVCLGYQGIGHLFGAKITHAPRIMHGRLSQICLTNATSDQGEKLVCRNLFEGIPSPFWAVRYHSLVIDPDTLPSSLIPTAYCVENDADIEALLISQGQDGSANSTSVDFARTSSIRDSDKVLSSKTTLMAFQHTTKPIWGVQFHPESISTDYGKQMLCNFQQATVDWRNRNKSPIRKLPLPSWIRKLSVVPPLISPPTVMPSAINSAFRLAVKCIGKDLVVDSGRLFQRMIEQQARSGKVGGSEIVWLDSARPGPLSAFSYLSTAPAFTLTYSTLHRQVSLISPTTSLSHILSENETFFTRLSQLLSSFNSVPTCKLGDGDQPPNAGFRGGLIGYLGYEMKRESMQGYFVPEEQRCGCLNHKEVGSNITGCCKCMEEPDAAFHFLDRFVVYDHVQKSIWAYCLVRVNDVEVDLGLSPKEDIKVNVGLSSEQCEKWVAEVEVLVSNITRNSQPPNEAFCDFKDPIPRHHHHNRRDSPSLREVSTPFVADATQSSYLASIRSAVSQIHEGESYEICLTTHFRHDLPALPACSFSLTDLYTNHLRVQNSTPFSALLTFPSCEISVLSASPERFLKVDRNGTVEMKPVKGTVAVAKGCVCSADDDKVCDEGEQCEMRIREENMRRVRSLRCNIKERGENMMIVDLIRNDLAQICDPTSVKVPKLIHAESYETVHQLVSTVVGELRPDIDCVMAVAGCFPPGSMTGAPKLRSIQILDSLENHVPRGIYSGCLGYFSIGDSLAKGGKGTADFNVVIRTGIATTSRYEGDDGKTGKKQELSIGAGGAITFLSNPEEEWEEVLLKSRSVAPSVLAFLNKLGLEHPGR